MASFTFIASNCLPFDANTLDQKPLGGTETAVIRLAERLADHNHSVTVYTKHPSPTSSKVTYISLDNFKENFSTDVLIAVREWLAALVGIKAKRRFLWTGDAHDQTTTYGIGDRRVSNSIDGLICVSAWHATTLSSLSGFPIEKTYVIKNGVHLPHFEQARKKNRKALIYSSTPYRGLKYIQELFRAVKLKHPQAVLNIYSGYEVYGGGENHDLAGFEKLKTELQNENGIKVYGNIIQKDLAQHFLESSILFYPNTFAETSCITALESQAAGCVVLSSKLGALTETVGDCGILIEGHPSSEVYQAEFVKAADRLLSNDQLWENLSYKSIQKIKNEYSWDKIAIKFEDLTLKNLKLSM